MTAAYYRCRSCGRTNAFVNCHCGAQPVVETINGQLPASYTCFNCGQTYPIQAPGRGSMPYSQKAALWALVFGIVLGVLSETILQLSQLWAPLPWIVGLASAGGIYTTLVEIKAHENLSDRG